MKKLVVCDHAFSHSECRKCPHAIPHKVRRPRQNKLHDGDTPCNEEDWCDTYRVQCKPWEGLS